MVRHSGKGRGQMIVSVVPCARDPEGSVDVVRLMKGKFVSDTWRNRQRCARWICHSDTVQAAGEGHCSWDGSGDDQQ